MAASRVATPRYTVGWGMAAGLAGGAAMMLYSTLASGTWRGDGWLTPLYHVASVAIGEEPFTDSLNAAAAGDTLYVQAGAALAGLGIHLGLAALFGVVFATVAGAGALRGAVVVAAGLSYGMLVMAIMAYVVLPMLGLVSPGGRALETMPALQGWGNFVARHLLFGAALGIGGALAAAARAPITGVERRRRAA